MVRSQGLRSVHFPLQIPTSVSVPSGFYFFHPCVSSSESPRSLLIFLALKASFCRPFHCRSHTRVFPLHLAGSYCIVSVSIRYVTCGLVSIPTQMLSYCVKKQITFHAKKDACRRVFLRGRGEERTLRADLWLGGWFVIVLLSKKQWLPLLWRNFEMQHRCVDYDAGEDHNNIHSVTQSSPAVAPVSDG